jgi:hypothetical protein
MAMNAVEELSLRVQKAFPDASVEVDAPTHDTGHWWLDAKRGNRKITVEWRPKQGFGLGFGPGGYGEGPDLVVSSVDDATERILGFLRSTDEVRGTESTVLLASGDFAWRSSIEHHLKAHRVWADAVSTIAEAADWLVKQTYVVVLVDVATEPPAVIAAWRNVLSTIDSLIITIAGSDHVPTFGDPFELIMHKRSGPEYVATVVESLVAAAATGRLPESHSRAAPEQQALTAGTRSRRSPG